MSASIDTDGSDLSARVRMLEDERKVLDRLYAYGHTLDYGLDAEWLDCFTEDAVYDLRFRIPTGRPGLGEGTMHDSGVMYRGRAQLATFVAAHTRAPDRWHKHLSMAPRITIDGDEATCASYFARLDDDDTSPSISSFGRYLDRLVRCSDGAWRFSARVFEIEGRKVQSPTASVATSPSVDPITRGT